MGTTEETPKRKAYAIDYDRGRLQSRKDVPDYIRGREVGPAENMSTKSTQAELQEQEELQLMNNVNESQLFGSEGNTANMHEK